MTVLNGLAQALGGDGRRRALSLLLLAALVTGVAAVATRHGEPLPLLKVATGGAPDEAAERYALPITAPLDQGDTGLCWVYAALSMLETNYMTRHPGAHIEFSRAALERDALADRFRRLIHGEPGDPGDGGLGVEALALIRQNGLVDRNDFHDVVDDAAVLTRLKETVAKPAEPERKERALDEALTAALGAKPTTTHLGGRPLSPAALAKAALEGQAWTEFDLARDGVEGWGPSQDPDARADTRVRYVALARLIDLIHRSLARGQSVVAGTDDHAFLVYGADYDRQGRPLDYLIKDSLAPYAYRLSAAELHRELHDVTVEASIVAPQFAGERSGPRPGGTAEP
jgi:hypothetical protein